MNNPTGIPPGIMPGILPGVLIVEDEFLVALDLEEIVSQAGYRVVGIVSDLKGVEALTEPPVAAFVDLNLRDGPTGGIIAKLLAEKFGTRIIFVTANPAKIGELPETVVGMLPKPFSPKAIKSSLQYALAPDGNAPPSELKILPLDRILN